MHAPLITETLDVCQACEMIFFFISHTQAFPHKQCYQRYSKFYADIYMQIVLHTASCTHDSLINIS